MFFFLGLSNFTDTSLYVYQIAVTFWRAVGGDEDEIEGLFDDVDAEASM